MKKKLTIILFGLLPYCLVSQIPQAFNYQTVVRNSDGEIQFNTDADFFIELLQNSNIIYSEEHSGNSGKTGVFNFQIGQGNNPSSDFSLINWGQGQLQIRITLNGEQDPIGTADIVAVPFALYAQNSGDSHWIKTDSSLSYSDTNVGIGTASPSEAFEVRGRMKLFDSSHYKLDIYTSDSGWDNIIRSFDENDTGLWTINMGDRDEADNFLIDRPANGRFDFVINTNGFIGLNTKSPNHPLDIHGLSQYKIGMHSANASQDNFIRSFDENGSQMWAISMGDRDQNDIFLIDRPGNGLFDFVIDNSGKVGIGTLPTSSNIGLEMGPSPQGVIKLRRANFITGYAGISFAESDGNTIWSLGMGGGNPDNNKFHIDLEGVQVMTFDFDERVGIGTDSPTAKLSVNGSVNKPGGGMWSTFSDKKLKTDISLFTDGLEKVKKITPVRYRYNGKLGLPNDKNYVGVIAQDIQKIIPYSVEKIMLNIDEEPSEVLSFNSSSLLYLAINAIKELDKKVDEIIKLKEENQDLHNRIEKLEQQMNIILSMEKKQ